MKKTVRIGTIDTGRGRRANVFCKIEFNGKLSISGVIGPLASGNALGGCGQIDMEFAHRNPEDNDKRYSQPITPEQIKFAPGWDREKWFTFLDIWKEFHLNDMQAGCEHQRAEKWGKKEIQIVNVEVETWRIKDVEQRESVKRALEKKEFKSSAYFLGHIVMEAMEAAKRGEVYTPKSDAEKSWFDGGIIKIKTETKLSGWVYPSEHPDGVMTKACPVCGYKYGTEWKTKTISQEAIDFLAGLPETDKIPAWT